MAVQWSADQFGDDLKKQLGNNLEAAAIYLKSKVKEALNVENPYTIGRGPKGLWYHGTDPSKPGEPPRKIRGDLQRSIAHEMSSDRQHAYVGSSVPYALYLEVGTSKMEARPFLRSTLMKERDTLAKIIATGKAK